ncbi:hypothetical protein F4814DRAFT_424426 [Daldinia grandis]|nr:hypothetical protein F4814DRAFT_424426 [Daldinia grandis]
MAESRESSSNHPPDKSAPNNTSEDTSVPDTFSNLSAVDSSRPTSNTSLGPTIPGSSNVSSNIWFPTIMKPFCVPPPPSTRSMDPNYLLYVRIFHPYYPPGAGRDPMLRFLTSDGGAQYLMVYYACCILAGNCMKDDEGRDNTNLSSPFLSRTQYMKDRIKVPANDILETGDYYFIMPPSCPSSPGTAPSSSSTRGEHYAITPTFDDWDIPKVIPSPWHQVAVPLDQSDLSPAETRAAQPCYLSSSLNSVQQAHIIPGAEVNWAKRNQIGNELIGLNKDVLEDWRNKIPIRSDLHYLWDHGYLTFLPKSISGTATRVYELCVHVNRVGQDPPKGYENIELYQNRIIRNLHGVPANFLFARFAWSIFNEEVLCLFRSKQSFLVRIKVLNEVGEYDEECKELQEHKICKRTPGSSRLYSPRVDRSNKRKRSNEKEDEDCLSSSEFECDGYLSATDMSSPRSTYDETFDAISDWDSADDASNETDCEDSIPRQTRSRAQVVSDDTSDDHYPVKRQRPSHSNLDAGDFPIVASRQAAEGDNRSLPSPDHRRTPDLSRSVETIRTDKDVVEESNDHFRLDLLPPSPTTDSNTCDRSSSFNKGQDRPIFKNY